MTVRRGVTVMAIVVISGTRKLPRLQDGASLKVSRCCRGCAICRSLYSPGGGNAASSRERHLEAAWAAAVKDSKNLSGTKGLPNTCFSISMVTSRCHLLPNRSTSFFVVWLLILNRERKPGVESIMSYQYRHTTISFA